VDRIAKRDFRELERWIEGLAQRHVHSVSGEGVLVIRSVPTVNIDALRVENALDLLKKRGVHGLLIDEMCV
jgi:hypothetical protein